MKSKSLLAVALVCVVVLVVVSGLLSACAHDPNRWLEGIQDPKALAWVKEHNAKSLGTLEKDPRYARIEAEVRKILLAKDRIPMPALRGGYIYNFWQDEKSVRGIWRRVTVAEYGKHEPKWELVIDLDALSAAEHENWVWKGANCLPPKYERCLLDLSRGGKDAVVVREFDIPSRSFIEDGFKLPEAKSDVTWIDQDRVLVGTDWGPGSVTAAGYPRITRLWRRGQPAADAPVVATVPETYMVSSSDTFFSPDGNVTLLVSRPSFFETEAWLFEPDTRARTRIDIPSDAVIEGYFRGHLLVKLRSEWKTGASDFGMGALVSISLSSGHDPAPRLVYAPDPRSSLDGVAITRDAVLLTVLENVKGRIYSARPKSNGTRADLSWELKRQPLPGDGVVGVAAADPFSSVAITSYESLLVPPTLLSAGRVLKRLPARFDTRGLVVEQLEAVSRDGTRVPYFIVSRRGAPRDGSNPTLLYAYGGFEISVLPFYAAVPGRVWLERGAIYVQANIRGGGEFGPSWHKAALKEKRQNAFDDFAAVAADLIRRGITKPAKLGIMGASNGGLLMGATFTQHPELFEAVVCKVPLLDMLRYHHLLAGFSWEGEYGDPDDSTLRSSILAYSPYQNVRRETRYPEVFFETSTLDDRVHPGHARKMVAQMESLGHSVFYFENTEGGHGAAANLEQRIHMISLDYTYLSRKLDVQ